MLVGSNKQLSKDHSREMLPYGGIFLLNAKVHDKRIFYKVSDTVTTRVVLVLRKGDANKGYSDEGLFFHEKSFTQRSPRCSLFAPYSGVF